MERIAVTIYRRHSKDCLDKADRYAPRCGCPLWFQYQLDGEQQQHTSDTRTFAEAQRKAKELVDKLEAGESLEDHRGIAVERATEEWLKVREQDGRKNDKPKTMVKLLLAWCQKEGIKLLRQISTPRVMAFRLTLPFRTGDSSSLKVHWSVIGGFFNWATGMGYISKSPIPNPRQNPQFKITFKKQEVLVPSKKNIEKAINTATGKTKLMMLLQRWSGMAISDAIFFERNRLEGTLVRGNRRKTKERFRIRIPQELADALRALPCDEPHYFFVDGGRDQVRYWQREYRLTFKAAKVKMSSHLFRHFRITELLASGVRVEDVAIMVGTSPQEIRKTYQHWIKEAEDRLDDVQRKEWLRQGLDENGNERTVMLQ